MPDNGVVKIEPHEGVVFTSSTPITDNLPWYKQRELLKAYLVKRSTEQTGGNKYTLQRIVPHEGNMSSIPLESLISQPGEYYVLQCKGMSEDYSGKKGFIAQSVFTYNGTRTIENRGTDIKGNNLVAEEGTIYVIINKRNRNAKAIFTVRGGKVLMIYSPMQQK